MTPLATLVREALADLVEDARRVRAARGRVAAWRWVARETAGLVVSFSGLAASRAGRTAIWARRDVVSAARGLRRRPITTLSAVLTLAAGLTAVIVAGALATTLLLRPVSTQHADAVRRVVVLDRTGRASLRFSEAELERIRAALAGVAELASVNLQPVVLGVGDRDIQSLAEVVSASYPDLVGTDIAVGRPLLALDAAPGASPAVVLSDAAWRDHFARDPAAIGATVRINARAFTVVGVTRALGSSTFLGASVDAWIPASQADAMLGRDWRTNPADRFWTAFVRLAPAARPEAEARLADAASELARVLPDPWRERRLATAPGTVLWGAQRTQALSLSVVLGVLAALILVAAVANVGSLLVAGALAERSRAAILVAMGAGRAAIVRRQLVEGALVGAAAGAVTIAAYAWTRRRFAEIALLPTLSMRLDLPFDPGLVVAVVAGGAALGVLLAVGPAWWATRLDVAQTLRDGSVRTAGTAAISRARRWLVGTQVAVGMTLLVGASLLSRSLDALQRIDVGFPRTGLVAMDFDVEPSGVAAEALPALAREALGRAAALPGVAAAAMASRAPVDASMPTARVGRPGTADAGLREASVTEVTPAYFSTVGVRLLEGRTFTDAESEGGADVAIVNAVLAAALWPDGDALGRTLSVEPEGRTVRVVGIAGASKYRALAEAPQPHVYRPTAPRFGLALLVRAAGDPRRALIDVQGALRATGPGVVGFFPRTFDDHVAIDMLPTVAAARAAVALGSLALALSTVGLYGLVAWFVELRRREIGIRLALGAAPGDLRRLVIRQAVSVAGPGLAVGLLAATALATAGRTILVGVAPTDPWALAIGVGTLLLAVAAASYVPSRRATRVDPVVALRDQ